MKTKAYKIREQIAREIYRKLAPFCIDLEVRYSCNDREHSHIFYNEIGSGKYSGYCRSMESLECSIGILIWVNYVDNTDKYKYTLMWDKEKESKALSKELLKSADKCARAFDDLIGQWIKEGKIKE